MNACKLFLDRHAAIHARAMDGDSWPDAAEKVWADLTDIELRCRPTPQHNTIVWLLWHMARCEDVAVNTTIRGVDEVIDRDGWLPKLGITSRHIGTGATLAEVDMISQTISLNDLHAYRAAVGHETHVWASNVDFDSLSKLVSAEDAQRAIAKNDFGELGAWVGPHWAERSWTHLKFLCWLAIEHNWFHIGEIYVIRNLLRPPI